MMNDSIASLEFDIVCKQASVNRSKSGLRMPVCRWVKIVI